MIDIDLDWTPFDRVVGVLDRTARIDLRPFAEKLRGRLVDGNRVGLLAGTDADGNRTAELAESTLRDPRRGDGPARVPRNAESRMIAGFTAEPDVLGPTAVDVTGHWPDVPFVKYHTGKDRLTGRPARDPVGVRPDDMALIAGDAREFAELLLGFR